MPTEARPQDLSIAFVSDYVPRRCGIATFAADLCESVAANDAGKGVFVVAVNDTPEGYDYNSRVRFEMREQVHADYRLAAEFINVNQVSVVSVQHEFGIYGGPSGAYLLGLLRRLRRPVVTTLHTVLDKPDAPQLTVMREIARLSTRMVVMSHKACGMVQELAQVPADKLAVIPHGIPDVPFVDPSFYKDQFGVEGRKVMLTFGLLSPGKGIEYAIDAMARVVKSHPEMVYIVLGATHPHVRRHSGEEYRSSLQRRVHERGLDEHVRFVNRFVEFGELLEYIGAADIYVTPYLGRAQITSGTLAYALGCGKAVISTPYWYAEEMLADGRGKLVPFKDSSALAEQIVWVLEHEPEAAAMRKSAYNFCRKMTWKQVSQDYLGLFAQAREARAQQTAQAGPARDRPLELPEVDLRHLRLLTDDTGIFQHCRYATPDRRHGYCTDDNARALLATAVHWDLYHDESILPLTHTYLAFVEYAYDEPAGRFRNFMSYDRRWAEKVGSEDSHARALWALGLGAALLPGISMVTLATRLFLHALNAADSFSSPRSWAYSILGIHGYLRRFAGDSEVRRRRVVLSERLLRHFTDHMSDDWPWCENTCTYDNARLPQALLMSGRWMGRGDMIDVARRSLQWLLDVQTNEQGMLSVIGTDGWLTRGGVRSRYDQQPIEAMALVDACIEAFHTTQDRHWLEQAHKAFNWFLGDNDLRTAVYDFTTGGCRDGLHVDRANENQGAESTLAWLMSLMMLHAIQSEEGIGLAASAEARAAESQQGLSPASG